MLRNIGIKFILINIITVLLWAQPPTPNGWEDAVAIYTVEQTVDNTPQIATNQNWVHTLCLNDALELVHRRSSDHGFDWEPEIQRISNSGVVVNDGYQIVADGRGNVYAVWGQEITDNYFLLFSYSTNNGQNC